MFKWCMYTYICLCINFTTYPYVYIDLYLIISTACWIFNAVSFTHFQCCWIQMLLKKTGNWVFEILSSRNHPKVTIVEIWVADNTDKIWVCQLLYGVYGCVWVLDGGILSDFLQTLCMYLSLNSLENFISWKNLKTECLTFENYVFVFSHFEIFLFLKCTFSCSKERIMHCKSIGAFWPQ